MLHKAKTCFHQSAVQSLTSKMFSFLLFIKHHLNKTSLELLSTFLVFCTSHTSIIYAVPCNSFYSRVYFQQRKTCLTGHSIQYYCYISTFLHLENRTFVVPSFFLNTFAFIFIYIIDCMSFLLRHLKSSLFLFPAVAMFVGEVPLFSQQVTQ